MRMPTAGCQLLPGVRGPISPRARVAALQEGSNRRHGRATGGWSSGSSTVRPSILQIRNVAGGVPIRGIVPLSAPQSSSRGVSPRRPVRTKFVCWGTRGTQTLHVLCERQLPVWRFLSLCPRLVSFFDATWNEGRSSRIVKATIFIVRGYEKKKVSEVMFCNSQHLNLEHLNLFSGTVSVSRFLYS